MTQDLHIVVFPEQQARRVAEAIRPLFAADPRNLSIGQLSMRSILARRVYATSYNAIQHAVSDYL